ncbi:MAG: cytochrome P450, partial [Methanosarcinales archaeon]
MCPPQTCTAGCHASRRAPRVRCYGCHVQASSILMARSGTFSARWRHTCFRVVNSMTTSWLCCSGTGQSWTKSCCSTPSQASPSTCRRSSSATPWYECTTFAGTRTLSPRVHSSQRERAECACGTGRARRQHPPSHFNAQCELRVQDSIGDIAFGESIGALKNPDVPFAKAFDMAQYIVEKRFVSPGWQVLEYLNGTRSRLNHALEVMRQSAQRMIDQRRAAGDYAHRRDLLSRFMAFVDEETQEQPYLHNDKFLRDMIMNFMIMSRRNLSLCRYGCSCVSSSTNAM